MFRAAVVQMQSTSDEERNFAQARERAAAVALAPEEREGMTGERIGQELRRRRVAAIEELTSSRTG